MVSPNIIKTISQIDQPERTQSLKAATLAEPRYLSLQQARIITESYRNHPEEPKILQRAYALAAALRHIEIRIDPDEIIVGNRTPGIRGGVVFPEAGVSWLEGEIDTLPTRQQDTFLVNEEDIEHFR